MATLVNDKDIALQASPYRNKTTLVAVSSTVSNFTVAKTCSPKKGRVCIFDGSRFHASTKPQDHSRRLVITVNYK